jgi:rare lipoprotein A
MKRVSVVVALMVTLSGTALAQDILPKGAQLAHGEPQPHSLSVRHVHRGAGVSHSFVAHASYYGGGPRRYEPNAHTANGEIFNQWDLTAAHRTLPMGTRLLVTHKGRSVVVRINDRGPALWTGRSLDLSRGAATEIGLIESGVGAVQVQVLDKSDHPV